MADDLFQDSTMTFGEHIEELRAHLIRAIYGIVVALAVTIGFGTYVVEIIIYPVEQQLKSWVNASMERRIEEMEQAEADLPEDQKEMVHLELILSVESLEQLGRALAPGQAVEPPKHPITLPITASMTKVVRELSTPLAEVSGRHLLKTLSAQEAFMVYFKAALGAAVVLASPWVFLQIYSFIAVGLYAHERRFVNMSLPFSVGLFLTGVAVCYFLIFPFMLDFFLGVNNWMDLEPQIRLSEWIGFAVLLMIIFGVMFQLPLFMLVLERVGIVTHDQLAGKRKLAILIMFIVAAIATPADPTTQVLLAVPMCFLFELGLFLMRYFQRRNPFAVKSPDEEPEASEDSD